MRKINILVILIVIITILIPIGFSASQTQVVATYGETTHHNANYKNIVDDFFEKQSGVDLYTIDSKIITANEVNKVSSTITGKTYSSNQIYSSALVNLNDNGDLRVSVDKSKITTITGDMYISALKSIGITKGHVYVTSPITATGESALAGIMNSYEVVTDVEIPDNVKTAANNEIYTQSEIVKNSNVDADKLSDAVDDVKETIVDNNITDHDTIVEVINNTTEDAGLNLTDQDIENLATSIEELQNLGDDITNYQTEVSNIFNDTENETASGLFEMFK